MHEEEKNFLDYTLWALLNINYLTSDKAKKIQQYNLISEKLTSLLKCYSGSNLLNIDKSAPRLFSAILFSYLFPLKLVFQYAEHSGTKLKPILSKSSVLEAFSNVAIIEYVTAMEPLQNQIDKLSESSSAVRQDLAFYQFDKKLAESLNIIESMDKDLSCCENYDMYRKENISIVENFLAIDHFTRSIHGYISALMGDYDSRYPGHDIIGKAKVTRVNDTFAMLALMNHPSLELFDEIQSCLSVIFKK